MRRRPSRAARTGRLLLRLGGAAVTLAGLAAATVLGAVTLTLPQPGEAARIPGLSAPVTITFDTWGIPRIRAATEQDGAAALGFVHARDRMFQMELMRRAAAGEVSALAGPRALRLDRMMRVLGIRRAAEAQAATLPPDTRAVLDAYAAGVNAWIAAHGRFSSLQGVVLGRPAPWTVVDSLLWGKTMGLYLSGNWQDELARTGLLDRAPQAKLDQLWPPQDGVPGPAASAAPQRFAGMAAALSALVPRFPDPFTLPSTASNEWAVDAAHSTTGGPLLAGDPHLAFSAPGIWYLARVDTPGGTLVGATAPGVPFLVIGRNGRIAWTFTTTGADTEDLFVETVLPDGRYATPDGPAAFATRQEHIAVQGAPDEVLTVRESRHGPVVSDLLGGTGGPIYAAALASLQPDDDAATGLLALNRAATVAEAGSAAPRITSPVQNLLAAGPDGIGQFTTGRVPVRRGGDGEWPVAGANGGHDWVGWASGAALPHVVNPPSGRIVNGNERTAPPGFPVFMGRDSFGDWRARRIRALLGDGRHDVAGFAAMQVDVTSAFAQAMLPALLARPRPAGMAGDAAALLQGWNGTMAADAPQPLVFNAWIQRFVSLALEQAKLPATAARPWADFAAFVLGDGAAAWCGAAGCGPLLDAALGQSTAALAQAYGTDPARWRWGNAHQATFGDPVVAPFTRRIPQPGDDTTIFRGGSRWGSWESVHGPGYRGVYDLADPDRSLFVTAPGQSGHPFSRHAADLMQRWRDGAGLPIGPVPGGTEATLALRPAQGD